MRAECCHERVDATREPVVLGIAVALSAELKSLTSEKMAAGSWRALSDNILVALSGMGADRAYRAGALLADHGANILYSWGCASALDIRLRAGNLVLPERVIAASGETYVADRDLHRQLYQALSVKSTIATGALVESTEVLQTPKQKQRLAERTLAIATDMESAAQARLARKRGLPFVAIRAIADTSFTYIPETALNALDKDSCIKLGKFLTNIALTPADWPNIIRLAIEFNAARKTLKKTAHHIFDIFDW